MQYFSNLEISKFFTRYKCCLKFSCCLGFCEEQINTHYLLYRYFDILKQKYLTAPSTFYYHFFVCLFLITFSCQMLYIWTFLHLLFTQIYLAINSYFYFYWEIDFKTYTNKKTYENLYKFRVSLTFSLFNSFNIV